MSLIAFVIFCFVVILIAWVAVWAMGTFLPGHPAIVDTLVWGIAILIIVLKILTVTGIMGHDPMIPRV